MNFHEGEGTALGEWGAAILPVPLAGWVIFIETRPN